MKIFYHQMVNIKLYIFKFSGKMNCCYSTQHILLVQHVTNIVILKWENVR